MAESNSNYKVGQVVTGVVSAREPYGVFVRLPGGEFGLLQVICSHDDPPSAVLPDPDESITCLIIDLTDGPKGPKLALSRRTAEFARFADS